MKITLAGGSGFLGTALRNYFEAKGHLVRNLTRKPKKLNDVYWDGKNTGNWMSEIKDTEILINLAGKSVDCRYTEINRKKILDSRTDSTRILHRMVKEMSLKPKVWINASSATAYIHSDTLSHTEDRGIVGDDFSMNVVKNWESEFFRHAYAGTRQIAIRTSIVLGKKGGAYPKMKLLARFGMGGYQGLGIQKVSWIHLEDFCRGVEFLIQNQELEGIVNLTSPHIVSNAELMKAIRQRTGVAYGLNQARWLLELGAAIVGTETELLLKSRSVYPLKLLKAGFTFKYPALENAIKAL
jgi:hypothetical protein